MLRGNALAVFENIATSRAKQVLMRLTQDKLLAGEARQALTRLAPP